MVGCKPGRMQAGNSGWIRYPDEEPSLLGVLTRSYCSSNFRAETCTTWTMRFPTRCHGGLLLCLVYSFSLCQRPSAGSQGRKVSLGGEREVSGMNWPVRVFLDTRALGYDQEPASFTGSDGKVTCHVVKPNLSSERSVLSTTCVCRGGCIQREFSDGRMESDSFRYGYWIRTGQEDWEDSFLRILPVRYHHHSIHQQWDLPFLVSAGGGD